MTNKILYLLSWLHLPYDNYLWFICFIQGSSNSLCVSEDCSLDFWERECPSDCSFNCLKFVKLTDIAGVLHEMEFIKYLLKNSPVLETMSIVPCIFLKDKKINMLIDLLRFRRASAQAEIVFVQN